MRRFLPGVVNLLVTSLAGLGSHILGHFGRNRTGHWRGARLNTLTCGRRTSLAVSKRDDEKKEEKQLKSAQGNEPHGFAWTGMIRGDH